MQEKNFGDPQKEGLLIGNYLLLGPIDLLHDILKLGEQEAQVGVKVLNVI